MLNMARPKRDLRNPTLLRTASILNSVAKRTIPKALNELNVYAMKRGEKIMKNLPLSRLFTAKKMTPVTPKVMMTNLQTIVDFTK